MTKFVFQGTGHTTGGGSQVAVGLAAAGVIAALAFGPARGAVSALGDVIVIGAAAVTVLALGVAAAVVIVRMRRRSASAECNQQSVFWKANPNAIPVQPRREIAAPVVTVNIDAGLLAGLMNAMQPQPVRVVAEQPEQQEIQS